MAHSLSSNLGLNLSMISKSSSKLSHWPQLSKLKPLRVRAMTGEASEKLDHIARSQHKHYQAQPKKRLVPSPPIGLWDRFPTAKTVHEMMETVERMMEDPFAMSTIEWPSSPLPSEGAGGYQRRGRTPWEIKVGESEYKMRFDMPGMNKEDVKVWVEKKMLIVKAEKEPKKKHSTLPHNRQAKEDDEEWFSKGYGRYSSRIALPENVQLESIKAEVKDGVLYITIPKATCYTKLLDISVQ